MMLRITLACVLLLGVPVSADKKAQTAFEVDCPTVSVIVIPATGLRLAEAKRIAECLGEREANVCTVQTIRVTRQPAK